MKNKYILFITCFLIIVSDLTAQVSGVIVNITSNNISLAYNLNGNIYSPSTTTIWTDDAGNQVTCSNLCSLDDVFSDIEPGRYCVQVIIYDYYNAGDTDSECPHGVTAISECFDIEGGTCGSTGEMTPSPIDCLSSTDGSVSYDGELAECLQGNAKFLWSNGETNSTPSVPKTSIDQLSPGKYCVKITPFDHNGEDCDCTAYFCAEIGSIETEPLAIRSLVRPMRICKDGPSVGKVLSSGSIRVSPYGGSGAGYSFRWIGGQPPAAIPPVGTTAKGQYRYCVELSDDCGNMVTKCFTIPKIYEPCNIEPPNGGGRDGKIVNSDDNNVLPSFSSSEEVDDTQNRELRVFPVPANDVLYIEFKTNRNERLSLSLINSYGGEVMSKNVDSTNGSNRQKIDISHLSEGFYYIKVKGFQLHKFIKIN